MIASGLIDKHAARRAFDRAADSYDQAAVLQRELAVRMLERLDYIRLRPRQILDLGCGTGFALDALAQRYPEARLLALDFALAMVQRSRQRDLPPQRLLSLCADIDNLPLADNSVDLVFANATLQWSNDLEHSFAELYRCLRPGGLLLFTTFGPDTLIELRHAWAQVDGGAHVSPFWDMHDIGDALVRTHFADPVLDVERITLTYSDLRALMRDLKHLGAQNPLHQRPRGLTSRQRLAALESAYEPMRTAGRLPSTWEVVHGQAWIGATKHEDAFHLPISAIGRQR